MQQPPPQRDFWSFLSGCQGCLSAAFFLGLFVVLGGGLSYWGWTILQNARASAAWPTTQGVITRNEVTHSSGTEGGDSYSPEVTYEYLVENRQYENYTIKFGENSYDSRREAEAIAAKYPLGAQVIVYYDPGNPDSAVLEPGVSAGSYIVLGIGILFIVIAFITAPLILIFRNRG